MSKQPNMIRCLISEVRYVRGERRYAVDVLQADTANLSNKTGVGATFFLPSSTIREIKRFHDVSNTRDMVGLPILSLVTYEGSNILGRSCYAGNVY